MVMVGMGENGRHHSDVAAFFRGDLDTFQSWRAEALHNAIRVCGVRACAEQCHAASRRKDSLWKVVGQSVSGARQGVKCIGEARLDLKLVNARMCAQTLFSIEYDANGLCCHGDVVTRPPRIRRQGPLREEVVVGVDRLF
jgi:hypothetical protein